MNGREGLIEILLPTCLQRDGPAARILVRQALRRMGCAVPVGEVLVTTLLPSWSLSWPSITTISPPFMPELIPTLLPVVWAMVTTRMLAVSPPETT